MTHKVSDNPETQALFEKVPEKYQDIPYMIGEFLDERLNFDKVQKKLDYLIKNKNLPV